MAGEELPLIEMVLATGALGTAAFGIVDAFKWFQSFATIGFGQIESGLSWNVLGSLEKAYGSQYISLIKGQYIDGRSSGDLVRTLRQGVRIGLSSSNAAEIARDIGFSEGDQLAVIATKLENGEELDSREKNILGRFELGIDTRIDAAIALAENRYRGSMRVAASIFAVGMSLLAVPFITPAGEKPEWILAWIVGIAAVPLAPIAKDVATALSSAAKALKSK